MHHWADKFADKVIKKRGECAPYICASGITPSGTVHFGNVREIMSVDLVARALRDRGKQVRFLYFWDDYDAFRKVPSNLPEQFSEYLRLPLDEVPDPQRNFSSFATANEKQLERLLPSLGIFPQFMYQAEIYRRNEYAECIRQVLEEKEKIKDILNDFRKMPLPTHWWPVTVYSEFTNKDATRIESWDGQWQLHYLCQDTKKRSTVDIRRSSRVKLLWRIDWPMRWFHYHVDVEPAGKDHHSDGGSFDTSRLVVEKVFHTKAPESFQYDFVGIKGMGGKMSSSTGRVLSLQEVLAVYQPQVVRYLFVRTRPNSEFTLSFDLDVIKTYEDYDRCERKAFDQEGSNKKRVEERRIWELSQTTEIPDRMPVQLPFRHLCNLLQIDNFSSAKTLKRYFDDEVPLSAMQRVECAIHWLKNHAPKEFCFQLCQAQDSLVSLSAEEKRILTQLRTQLDNATLTTPLTEEYWKDLIQKLAAGTQSSMKEVCVACYKLLIARDKGPRLVNFLQEIGIDIVMQRLEKV